MNIKNNKEKGERKNSIRITNPILRILAYSVNRIIEKQIDEKSVRNPATNSDSASGKSKGTLLDSAKRQRKEICRREIKER